MIPGSANPLLLASAAAAGDYQVSRSLRFNSQYDTSYLTRTNPTAGNRRTWTFSAWIKRTNITDAVLPYGNFIYTGGGTSNTYICFGSASATGRALDENALCLFSPAYGMGVSTNAIFRDLSAWFHLVVKCDTTQATGTDRVKFYINGVEQATTFSSTPALNAQTGMNDASAQKLGIDNGNQSLFGMMGYMAEVYMIDGQALTPSSFTEVSATTGQLLPKAYSGTYGTNGFYLKFADNSTTAALGTDSSGNGNTWTTNNFSVTAGAGNDSLVDTPTSYGTPDTGVGGEVRGNYCTWNALKKGAAITDLTNGNLDWLSTTVGANYLSMVLGTIGVASGKWYWEITVGSLLYIGIGIATDQVNLNTYPGGDAYSWSYLYNAVIYNNGNVTSYGASYTTGDIIGVALNLDTGTLTFYKNGVSQGVAYSGLSGPTYFPMSGDPNSSTNGSLTVNFGQRAFAYTAPSGFKALCDTNIPEGTITTSGTYTGNGVADGPFVYLNGVPTAMTVGANAVTFGTHADKLSNGFKLRTTNVLYNQNALSYSYSITTTGAKFKYARAQPNP